MSPPPALPMPPALAPETPRTHAQGNIVLLAFERFPTIPVRWNAGSKTRLVAVGPNEERVARRSSAAMRNAWSQIARSRHFYRGRKSSARIRNLK